MNSCALTLLANVGMDSKPKNWPRGALFDAGGFHLHSCSHSEGLEDLIMNKVTMWLDDWS
jgi:hypothetical protein